MTSSTPGRRLVPIGQYTTLAGQDIIRLPGQDLFHIYVRNVHVVPGQIDVDRFEAALSKTLTRYPPSAGRLFREKDDWLIKLTNDPVPLIVAPSTDAQRPFADGFVIQPTDLISKFTNTEDADQMFLQGGGSEPLVAFKLTIAADWTAVGIAFAHSLGDANALIDFMITLSKYYEGAEDQLPLEPYFERHFFPPPWSSASTVKENFLPRLPHYAVDFDATDITKLNATDIAATTQVQFRLSSQSISKMYATAQSETDVKISVQDAMTAYVMTALTQSLDKPIVKAINVINGRFPPKLIVTAPKFAHPASWANHVLHVHTEPVPEAQALSVGALTKAIRASVEVSRHPDFIEGWQTFASWLQVRALNLGRYHYFDPLDEWQAIFVNSNYRFDWNNVNFGHPGKASIHTSWISKHSLRVFRSNIAGETVPGVEAANVSFLIKKEARDKFVEVVLRDYPDTVFQDDVSKVVGGLRTFWSERKD